MRKTGTEVVGSKKTGKSPVEMMLDGFEIESEEIKSNYQIQIEAFTSVFQNILLDYLSQQLTEEELAKLQKNSDDPKIAEDRKKKISSEEGTKFSDVSRAKYAYYQFNSLFQTLMKSYKNNVSQKNMIHSVFTAMNIGIAIGKIDDEKFIPLRQRMERLVGFEERKGRHIGEFSKILNVIFEHFIYAYKRLPSDGEVVIYINNNLHYGIDVPDDIRKKVKWGKDKGIKYKSFLQAIYRTRKKFKKNLIPT